MMAKPKKETMTEKVVYNNDADKEASSASMFGGMVVLFIGLILVIIGIVFLVLYKLPPRLDQKMAAPVLTQLPENTNEKKITVKGRVENAKKVILYVNDETVADSINVKNNEFSYDYTFGKEGNYKFEAVAVKGFPIRYRSAKSSPVVVAVDWTLPSKDVNFTMSKDVDTKTITVKGTAEPNSTVTIKNGDTTYSGVADSKGNFEIKNVQLSKGTNKFSVEITDKAGNKVALDSDLVITYKVGSINGGNGSTNLPESAGNLSDAMREIFANKLMGVFGVIALLVLAINSALVAIKLRRESI